MPADVPSLSSLLSVVGRTPPRELTEARVRLHFAAQPVAAFGFTVLDAREDFSHTALHWSHAANALVSETDQASGLFAALHIRDFAVALHGSAGEVERLPLDGRTLDDVYDWLEQALGRAGRPATDGIVKPGHMGDMPTHPVGEGGALASPDAGKLEELEAWMAAADVLLRDVVAQTPAMGPALCWPHHFDTATLHVLAGSGESMRSVGVGLSPGDGAYDQPYVYVTPWPYPEGPLPSLPGGGTWHTEGWTGAVLRADALLEGEGGEARAHRLLEFVRFAHGVGVERLTGKEGDA
ncbi:MAG: hypothetical protein K0V04_42310 [Deltaproteobacteria bacterium]|nr:hypothetical protein [Deltaproteobacteria bacterium]